MLTPRVVLRDPVWRTMKAAMLNGITSYQNYRTKSSDPRSVKNKTCYRATPESAVRCTNGRFEGLHRGILAAGGWLVRAVREDGPCL